ncbi:MAG TPA: acyltransferase [Trueperaceae bacterium]|nr:acyltransferase [Trueperaceae bacterium]
MSDNPTDLVGALVRRMAGLDSRVKKWWDRKTLPSFATPAAGFEMQRPRSIVNAAAMHIGTGVKLGSGSELKANTRFPGGWMRHPQGEHISQDFQPTITIGDRVTATGALQVVAFKEIVIEDDVMFAANIFVSDGSHGTTTGEVPYKYQGITGIAPIRIGRGSWIGQNAVIMPGVTIGELAVIGANSVVTNDVPPRCVAVGAPARIVKRWDLTAQRWRRVEEQQ